MKLGQILVQKKWIAASQLEQIIQQQLESEKKLGELLVNAQLITSEQLNNALREQYWRNHGYWVIH